MLRIFAFLIAVFVAGSATAWMHGNPGSGSGFNPSQWPGALITCFRSQASGACGGGTFAQYFNAPCNNGVGDDQTAAGAYLTYALANNPTQIVLYIPPGSTCSFSGGFGFFTTDGNPGITNPVVWGYGASVNSFITVRAFYDDANHEALIQDATAGDTSVVLKTASDASRFNVGDWICIGGLAFQPDTQPPNIQYFGYRQITAITGTTTKTIAFSGGGLSDDLKSNWPIIPNSPHMTQGPAAIYLMQPSWALNAQIFGLTLIAPTTSFQFSFPGKTIAVTDVTLSAINNPTWNMSASLSSSYNHTSLYVVEVDKIIETLNITNSNGFLLTQSSAVKNTNLTNNVGLGFFGYGRNLTVVGGVADDIHVGPSFFGASETASFNGFKTTTAEVAGGHFIDVTWLAGMFSAGVFTIANADGNFTNVMGVAVPGRKYIFAAQDNGSGPYNSSPLTTFVIDTIASNGTNTAITLKNCSWGACTGALPTPTCNGVACTRYLVSPGIITQINTPSGGFDISQFSQ
jgi:hypothetical protein